MLSLGLAFVAGVLTVLSPCVLPLLPMILASAAAEHRYATAALAAGVGLSFSLLAGLLASLGFAAGLEGSRFRVVAALLLATIGLVMLLPRLQGVLSAAARPLANFANGSVARMSTRGLGGQFALGLLLGAVWTPCAGPTLGAASVLAAEGRNPAIATLTMLLFGLGAGAALAIMGLASRTVLTQWRGRMLEAGRFGKIVVGVSLVLLAAGIITGADKQMEAILVEASPLWLTELTSGL